MRRNNLVAKIRHSWLLSNDRLSQARSAGSEWGINEKEFVISYLRSVGEDRSV